MTETGGAGMTEEGGAGMTEGADTPSAIRRVPRRSW